MATYSIDEILKLPPKERIEIAQAIWDSLDEVDQDETFVLTDDQAAELDRRWAALEANPDAAISLDEMKRRLRERRGSSHPV